MAFIFYILTAVLFYCIELTMQLCLYSLPLNGICMKLVVGGVGQVRLSQGPDPFFFSAKMEEKRKKEEEKRLKDEEKLRQEEEKVSFCLYVNVGDRTFTSKKWYQHKEGTSQFLYKLY